MGELREKIGEFEKLKEELESIKGLVKEDKFSSSPTERAKRSEGGKENEVFFDFANARVFEEKLRAEEFRVFLSGEYDKNSAILSITSGAGGQDAQDWAAMLLRMYERYCQRKGYKAEVLHQSFGEGGGPEGRIGIKSATLEIKGDYAYGFLKKETGVHRLVRVSPFSPKALRHTSFTLVDVLPEIEIEKEKDTYPIKPEDLKIDFYRASGPGGQYVNKRETSVRITHLPTGIVVACQSERLQGMNREKAMKILISKLHQLKEEKAKMELKEIKGEKTSASWGNQIRSYVLHPYKMVKDLRTNVETSNTEEVLDGNLDQFIAEQVFAEQSR